MGTNLKELVLQKEIQLKNLSGKIVAIDAFNYLYQFLTTIRQPDGTPLMTQDGVITSHLNGLFFRTMKLLEHNIKPIFVFDGKPPKLKQKERERRRLLKQEAEQKFAEAVQKKDVTAMKKYASRTTVLTSQMIEQSKELLTLMGLPIVDAPSEGEAQAAHMVKKRDAYAVVSQDYDALLFGCPRVIRNLSLEGRRKKGPGSVMVKPVVIELAETLNQLAIDHTRLIFLAMLIGTDYNIGGIHGIGPKKALKLVQEMSSPEMLFKDVQWDNHCTVPWTEVYNTISEIPVQDEYNLEWQQPMVKELHRILTETYGFSRERIQKRLDAYAKVPQEGLGKWLK